MTTYLVKRHGKDVRLPIESLTDDEIGLIAAALDREADTQEAEAREIRDYIADRDPPPPLAA